MYGGLSMQKMLLRGEIGWGWGWEWGWDWVWGWIEVEWKYWQKIKNMVPLRKCKPYPPLRIARSGGVFFALNTSILQNVSFFCFVRNNHSQRSQPGRVGRWSQKQPNKKTETTPMCSPLAVSVRVVYKATQNKQNLISIPHLFSAPLYFTLFCFRSRSILFPFNLFSLPLFIASCTTPASSIPSRLFNPVSLSIHPRLLWQSSAGGWLIRRSVFYRCYCFLSSVCFPSILRAIAIFPHCATQQVMGIKSGYNRDKKENCRN